VDHSVITCLGINWTYNHQCLCKSWEIACQTVPNCYFNGLVVSEWSTNFIQKLAILGGCIDHLTAKDEFVGEVEICHHQ
jgi:hypothetical protein